MLADEPFGALYAKVRKELRAWLRRLHDEVHITTVFVTHDQEEAMEVSDEIVIMNHGKVEQVGTPSEVYDRPATHFFMGFIGHVNIVSQSADRNGSHDPIFIRPQDILIELEPQAATSPARINCLIHLGWEVQIELVLDDGQVLMAHLTRDHFDNLIPQQRVHVHPKDTKSFALDYSI